MTHAIKTIDTNHNDNVLAQPYLNYHGEDETDPACEKVDLVDGKGNHVGEAQKSTESRQFFMAFKFCLHINIFTSNFFQIFIDQLHLFILVFNTFILFDELFMHILQA